MHQETTVEEILILLYMCVHRCSINATAFIQLGIHIYSITGNSLDWTYPRLCCYLLLQNNAGVIHDHDILTYSLLNCL